MNLSEFMKTQMPEQKPITAPAEKPDFDEVIPEGQRNSTMSRIAGRIIKRYGDTNEAKRRFAEKAAACNPPLDPKELQTIWSSAIKFGGKVSQQDGYIPPEDYNNPTPRKPADYSDLGQAYAFAKFCRDYVRYSPATDYIVYNGIYWEESKPRAQAALDEFTDAQLKEAEKHIADTEKYMETTGADAVIAEHGKNAAQFMNEEQERRTSALDGRVRLLSDLFQEFR